MILVKERNLCANRDLRDPQLKNNRKVELKFTERQFEKVDWKTTCVNQAISPN